MAHRGSFQIKAKDEAGLMAAITKVPGPAIPPARHTHAHLRAATATAVALCGTAVAENTSLRGHDCTWIENHLSGLF